MHCLERGHLMGKIWWSEMELFQRLLQLRQADAQIVQREREAYQAEADMLRRQVEEMQAAATRRPSPCQKPCVIADAHAQCPTSDAGQARCAWATVGGQAGAGWMAAMMAARGGARAFRSDAICVLRILRVRLTRHPSLARHRSCRRFSRRALT